MTDKDILISDLNNISEILNNNGYGGWCATIRKAVSLLKEQKQIKSPDEFKSLLLGMFDSIWDIEIDHPVFQDTVGELMEGVLQTYRQAVKWE